jgi:hypothetical protein
MGSTRRLFHGAHSERRAAPLATIEVNVTDTQLYLAIGIPSALFMLNFLGVLAGFFWQGKRFDDMSKRFDDMRDMFRSDLARVEGVLTAKIDGLSVRVKALEDEIHSPLVKR